MMRDNEPWFVLADVCRVLEITNSRDAAARLDDDEKARATFETPGGPQSLLIINESGLWSLVLRSTKPEAKTFKSGLPGPSSRPYARPELFHLDNPNFLRSMLVRQLITTGFPLAGFLLLAS